MCFYRLCLLLLLFAYLPSVWEIHSPLTVVPVLSSTAVIAVFKQKAYFVLKFDFKYFFGKTGKNPSYSGLQKDTSKESSSLDSSNIQTGAVH